MDAATRSALLRAFQRPSVERALLYRSPKNHEAMLEELARIPEAEAREILILLIDAGCASGFTLTRAEVYHHHEMVHQLYGCQNEEKCDVDNLAEPLPWERDILQDSRYILEHAAFYAVWTMFSWLRLANIVAQHEKLIRARWLKKTQSQRADLLKKVMPSIPHMHRPDMAVASGSCCSSHSHGHCFPYHGFPYVNLEDLSEPRSLLLFLNTRARYLPNKLAYSDFELGPLIQLRAKLLAKTKYTMDFIESYGGICEHASASAAQDSINEGFTMHPVHGFQVLMIQWNVIDFLFKCCKEILYDIPLGPIMATNPSPCLEELPPFPGNSEIYPSLDEVVREAPYRPPARLDLGRLRNLVSACRQSAEDHIWSLREDPEYFAETVLKFREHRKELLLDKNGLPVHTRAKERNLMNKVLRDVVTDAYVELYLWSEILQRVSRLDTMAKKYASQLHDASKELELPEPLFEAMVETWFYLEAVMLDFVEKLNRGWCASPALRHCFAQDTTVDCSYCVTSELRNLDKGDMDMLRLYRLMNSLGNASSRNTYGIHTIVDGIERLLQTNARAKVLTSSWTASYLSQLSVATECYHQLQLFQPWAKKVQYTVKERATGLFIAYAQSFAKWNGVLTTKFVGNELYDLGKEGGKWYYPVHKRRTRAHVHTMQSAEAALDAFWAAADARFRKVAGETPHDIVSDIIGNHTLQRTPDWVEPTGDKAAARSSQGPEYIYVPLSLSAHDRSKQITGAFDRLAITTMEKPKTHGESAPGTVVKLLECATPREDRQQIFSLDKRAFKVVKALFHSPFSGDQPGEVAWTDFLHTMTKIGFSAQKLQGSAWQFTPVELDSIQPIQFHEPHPSPKLPFTWGRRNGRRLSRAYGWSSETFRLA